ncbi:polymer-forming cytoskeletal protein [Candidatus Saccharibacteria bacterium]|nr:polymer-forming cytoskeletal protein [Candidatus Saccharibacteria bacterium]NIW78279.1 cell shape determination protein CcmA [Calditrichia bacterium]
MALKVKNQENSTNELNFIGAGTYLEGTIETKGSLRIDGKVKGVVKSNDRLTIGSTGEVVGEVHAKSAVVGGKVEGDVYIEQKMILEATSSLNGNLSTGKLIIDEGAFFNGKSAMGANAKSGDNGKKFTPDSSNQKPEAAQSEKGAVSETSSPK